MMELEFGRCPSGRSAGPSDPSQSSLSRPSAAAANASLRTPEAIWKEACAGREGYCSSDLQAAAKAAILIGQLEALAFAAALAPCVRLPDNYQWSDSNFRKFEFGAERMAEAITAAAERTLVAAMEDQAPRDSGSHAEREDTAGG